MADQPQSHLLFDEIRLEVKGQKSRILSIVSSGARDKGGGINGEEEC